MKRLYQLFGGNIVSVMLSGRDIDLINSDEFFKDNLNLITLLFGTGFKNENIIELDFLIVFLVLAFYLLYQ